MTRRSRALVAVTTMTTALVVSLSACSAGMSEPGGATGAPVAPSTTAATGAEVVPVPGGTPTSGQTPTQSAATASVIAENTLPPVPATAVASFGEGLRVRVVDQRREELEATLPGEVSGPGVVVELSFHNGSSAPVDLDGIRVSAFDRSGDPAPVLEGPPAQAATGVLPVGSDATTTVAFSMAPEAVTGMTLQITSTASSDVVVLAG